MNKLRVTDYPTQFYIRGALGSTCCGVDALLNCSRILAMTMPLLTSITFAGIAILVAVCPFFVSLHGSKDSAMIGLYGSIASFLLSVWSITGHVNLDDNARDNKQQNIRMAYNSLEEFDKSAARQIEVCKSRPSYGPTACDSIAKESELSQERQSMVANIQAMESTPPMSEFEKNVTIGIWCLMSLFLQIFATAFARQMTEFYPDDIANLRKIVPTGYKQKRSEEPKNRSQPKNDLGNAPGTPKIAERLLKKPERSELDILEEWWDKLSKKLDRPPKLVELQEACKVSGGVKRQTCSKFRNEMIKLEESAA